MTNNTLSNEITVKTGDSIYYGHRYWNILEVDSENKSIFLLSEEGVCTRAYHEEWEDITWENSPLRQWLNNEFFAAEFNDKEKESIIESHVQNNGNNQYETDGGNDTVDKVFLLSAEEVLRCFKNHIDISIDDWWMLRTPGRCPDSVACVMSDVLIYMNGEYVSTKGVVRPALRINLDSNIDLSLKKSCDETENIIKDKVRVISELITQKEIDWEELTPFYVSREQADLVLDGLTYLIAANEKGFKIHAVDASEYANKCAYMLSPGSIDHLIDTLQSKKLNKTAESLLNARSIAENAAPADDSNKDEEISLPDGSIGVGSFSYPLQTGFSFQMGKNKKVWRILDIDNENNTILVLCDSVFGDYYPTGKNWFNSLLRKELNNSFYVEEFIDLEKDAILDTRLYPDEEYYDKVFLLSPEEVSRYLIGNYSGIIRKKWGLRSSSSKDTKKYYIDSNGCINCVKRGDRYLIPSCGIRPAMRLNLDSDFCRSFIKRESTGELSLYGHKLNIKANEVTYVNPNVTEVVIPGYVNRISAGAIHRCFFLEKMNYLGSSLSIDKDAITDCPKLKLPTSFYLDKRFPSQEFAEYMPADPRCIAYVLLHVGYNNKYYACATSLIDHKNAAEIADILLQDIPNCEAITEPDLPVRFIVATMPVLGSERIDAFSRVFVDKKRRPFAQWEALLKKGIEDNTILANRVCKAIFDEELFSVNGSLYLDKWESLSRLYGIMNASYPYASLYGKEYVEKKEYKKAYSIYQKNEDADVLAAELDHNDLMNALKQCAHDISPAWYLPFAVFANDEELKALISEMKEWVKQGDLHEQVIRVRGAILLNDTITAINYADKNGYLKYYADIRNMNENEILDDTLGDYGLSISGEKEISVGKRKLKVSVNKDLTLTLVDETGKVLRSIPKKDCNTTDYEKAYKEYTEMKKGIISIAKAKNNVIFSDFLSGRKQEPKYWIQTYTKNPILRILASLIVWRNGRTTFTLDSNGNPIRSDGSLYSISAAKISVAHPLEMNSADIKNWQDYFTSNNLKQPFEQIWEPVQTQETVRADRYNEYTFLFYMLMNKEKHGILMPGHGAITLKGCDAIIERVRSGEDWYKDEYRIRDFTYDKYNRQVNHIVALLDKGTVLERVKKDDISIADSLPLFTYAQITDFIKTANKEHSVNALALLIDYKETHFDNTNPIDEFTLEW